MGISDNKVVMKSLVFAYLAMLACSFTVATFAAFIEVTSGEGNRELLTLVAVCGWLAVVVTAISPVWHAAGLWIALRMTQRHQK